MTMMITASTFLFEQQLCEQRGCCWSPLDERNAPWCFFSTNHGYTLETVEQLNDYGKSLFPLSPTLPVLSDWSKYLAFYLTHFLILSAPRSFHLSSSHRFSFFTYSAWGMLFCEIWHGWHIRKHDWLCSMQVFPFSAWFHRLMWTQLFTKKNHWTFKDWTPTFSVILFN